MISSDNASGAERSDVINHRSFIAATLIALLVLFLFMISGLLLGVAAGVILWSFTNGIFERFAKKFKKRSRAASLALLVTILLVIVPIGALVMLMVFDAATFAHRVQTWYEPHRSTVEARVEEFMSGGSVWIFDYEITSAEIMERVDQASGQIGGFLLKLVQKTAGGVAQAILQIFVALYTLFFFYLDGAKFLEWLKGWLPISRSQTDSLLADFFGTCRASLRTLGIIGLIQGSLGGLAFWICGIPAPFFWTMLMAIASVIPAVGAQIILVPAALLLILIGKFTYGIGLLLWSVVVIANIDNLLRPYLVKRETNLHELLVFLSTLGGIATFGFFGVFLGPVVAALLKTTIGIYSELQVQKRSA